MVDHVNSVCKSCYGSLYSLGRIRHYLTDEATITLVHAFITCKMDNLHSLLIGLPSYLLIKLQAIQNNAARIITRTRKHDHITSVLHGLHWLPVEVRIQLKVMLLTYKSLNGISPTYLADLLHYKQHCRTLRSSADHLLAIPKSRLKTVGDRSFSFYAAKSWNSLPLELGSSQSVETFKPHLKTFLFKRHYNVPETCH